MRGQPASLQEQTDIKVPGRIYSFVVLLLAAFLVGLTVLAIRPPLTENAKDTGPPPISRMQLQWLGGIAAGVAFLSLFPSRKAPVTSGLLTPQLVEQQVGVPILGSLFASPAAATANGLGAASRWLRTAVDMSEMLVFAAFTLAVVACMIKLDLVGQFRDNPLAGYVEAIRHLSSVVQVWLPAGMRDMSLKSQ
jgi:hypothetical protein